MRVIKRGGFAYSEPPSRKFRRWRLEMELDGGTNAWRDVKSRVNLVVYRKGRVRAYAGEIEF